jgi:hypothetical protein
MNKQDRKELDEVIQVIQQAKEKLEFMKEAEENKWQNLTEALQQTEKGQRFEEIVDQISEAIDSLDSTVDSLNSAME